MIKERKFLPLGKRLQRVIFLAGLIPYLLFLGFGVVNNILEVEKQAALLHEEIVKNTANIIDDYMKLLEVEMRLEAGKISQFEGASSTRLLKSLISFDHAFETLTLADMSGRVIEKVGRFSLYSQEELGSIIDTAAFSKALENKRYLSLVHLNQFKEPYIRISILIDDISQNSFVVLVADINLKYLREIVSNIDTGSDGYAYVIDRLGHLICYKDTSHILQGNQITDIKSIANAINTGVLNKRYPGLEGRKVIGKYKEIEGSDWFVIVESPLNKVMRNVIHTIYFGLIVSFLAFFLITLFVRYLATEIVTPILILKEGVSRFASGEFFREIEITSNDEIGVLAEAFNDMAVQLNQARYEFKQQLLELKKTAESFRASEDKFSKAFHRSPDSISITKMDTGEFLELNRGFEKMLGYTREEILGTSIMDLGIWKYMEDRVTMVEALKSEGRCLDLQVTGVKKNGEEFFGDISAEIILIEKTTCILTTIRDITEQKRSKELLERSERNYREIFNSGSDGIFILNYENGRILDVNKSTLEMFGYTREEIYKFEVILDRSIIEPYTKAFAIQKFEEVKKLGSNIFEWQAKRRDGSLFWIEVSLKTSVINDRNIVICIARDITERKNLLQTLIQSEKMLSLGGLAAGMAHEINNPLAGILQNAQAIINRIEKDTPANIETAAQLGTSMDVIRRFLTEREILSQLDLIRESGSRASKIVLNMLNFARKDEKRSSHDIVKLLEETLQMAESDYNLKKNYDFRSIQIQRNYERGPILVPCNPGQIQQVFFNILKNGAEAMSEQLSENKNESARFDLKVRRSDSVVSIEIKNNLSGISTELQSQIFEPFYTTKEVGVGTGLGLSVSFFIITETHQGELSVESDELSWVNFIIKLPVDS